MSDSVLNIELQPGPWPGEAYRKAWPIGGLIRGKVHVEPKEPIRANAVRVELGWHTEGRGDEDSDTPTSVTVYEGNLSAATRTTMNFELNVPETGPITYQGHYIHILWTVRAVVDIPWKRDLEQEETVEILPDYDDD